MKDDMILRQAALDALDEIRHVLDKKEKELTILPSAQPTGTNTVQVDDCISRQAAIKTMMAAKTVDPSIVGCASNAGVDWCIDAIKALPSAQGWIPVTERLPEKYDNYLITTKDEDTDIGTFHPEFKQWSICDADGFKLTDGVVAWMEKPKPWEWGQK